MPSPADNDTFTALTCIDWLGDCLRKMAPGLDAHPVHRDHRGITGVSSDQVSHDRLVQRACEKVRQASSGVPAMMIRQPEASTTSMEQTTDPQRGRVPIHQAAMNHRANVESVPEHSDRADVDRRHTALRALYERLNRPAAGPATKA
ncbi:hypothetical protein MSAS_23140 [Mycobacterium saskatchewanense]|uniref:Uncharacterized protein n=1 Tax=Mycobacterium saskatchewanense TaxID=220927 RepID=A0AAJ3TUC7_9MYCO|nr:hypothetical protein AWC23_17485 [Mycobacterium saskatchewanense]BBX63140.1 hypothetical protein MSAS_23140 [Mycobacterium saskatchewanense]